MKLNAIMTVKNEVDIVEETLLNAMKFCHKIYIYDNNSTDGTWEVLNEMAARFNDLVIVGQTDESQKGLLCNRIYNRYHSEYAADDWWYLLGADELLAESPIKALKRASAALKNTMNVWHAQFYFTDVDYENYESEDRKKPISQRRRYYALNGKSPRFFCNEPTKKWPENVVNEIPSWASDVYAESPISRRFCQRTPEQMQSSAKGRKQKMLSTIFNKQRFTVNYTKARTLYFYSDNGEFKFSSSALVKCYLKKAGSFLQNLYNTLLKKWNSDTKKLPAQSKTF
jgi:glycosyltransferase involved in cell wall biosynthesis